MFVVSGEADVLLDGRTERLSPGQAITIEPLMRHRVTAISDLDIVEVSTPELDDVVRLEDRYGREGTSHP